MAPEIFKEEGYNQKADIWSLGITAIELAEKSTPFKDTNPYAIMLGISQVRQITIYGHFLVLCYFVCEIAEQIESFFD
jgi:serine/threonine-protein kinase 24/25/MST4